MLPLLAALLFAPAGVSAAPPECRPLEGLGCWYGSPAALAAPEKKLLVYLRGHFGDSGNIAPDKVVASSLQAFRKFDLKALADREDLIVLVTGSSHLAVTEKEVTSLERTVGGAFRTLHVAAHSGGNVGLFASLPGLRRPDRIIMLDNFYFASDPKSPKLAEKVRLIQTRVAAGAVCTGFFTEHNRVRAQKHFQPVYCPTQAHDDYGHDGGVNRCLGTYLSQTNCP